MAIKNQIQRKLRTFSGYSPNQAYLGLIIYTQMGKLRTKDLSKIGYHNDQLRSLVIGIIAKNFKHHSKQEILILLKDKGLSNRKVAQMMNINRKTVNSYMQRFNALDLQYGELLSMDDSKLYDLFTEEDQTEKERYEILSSEFTKIQDELKRPGATLQKIWESYLQSYPGGYRYTQFTTHYRNWKGKLKASGKLQHKAGEKLFVDFCGKKMSYVDKDT